MISNDPQFNNIQLHTDHRDRSGYTGEGVGYSNKPDWLLRLEAGRRVKENYQRPTYDGIGGKARVY